MTDFVRKNVMTIQIGDEVQHPIHPSRFITVEWFGFNLEENAVYIAGFHNKNEKNTRREAIRYNCGASVNVITR